MSEPHRDDSLLSPVAVISYLLILTFAAVCFGVFTLLWFSVEVADAMLTVLGALVTCAVGGFTVVGGFWLATSIGSRANSAAIRQLAGAGAPPPAEPGAGVDPAEIPPETKT